MPEPITMAARKALPRNSAVNRRQSTASFTMTSDGWGFLGPTQQQLLVADGAATEIACSCAGRQPSASHPRPASAGASAITV